VAQIPTDLVRTIILHTRAEGRGAEGAVAFQSVAAKVDVPNVTGCRVHRARRMVEAAGLQLRVTGGASVEDDRVVITQTPLPGSQVPRGNVVVVDVDTR
jgi:beta-lactam-binding protein with PASTA domain